MLKCGSSNSGRRRFESCRGHHENLAPQREISWIQYDGSSKQELKAAKANICLSGFPPSNLDGFVTG